MNNGFELLKKELRKLENEVLGILLYGSYAKGEETPRSDIDICVVAGFHDKDKLKALFRKILPIIGMSEKYDIKIFEYMPLYMKIRVIKEGEPLFVRDLPALYEYFYFYLKLWEDQAIVRLKLQD